MKPIFINTLLSGLAMTLLSTTTYANSNVYDAEVVDVNPVYKTVRVNTPREECWQEQVAVRNTNQYDSKTPEIFGAILGAGIGNEFGSGKGKDLATVAGAVLGGSIGRDIKNNKRANQPTEVRYVEKCTTVDYYTTEERLEGYDVKYRYDNRIYSAMTRSDPGETIRVRVSVSAIE